MTTTSVTGLEAFGRALAQRMKKLVGDLEKRAAERVERLEHRVSELEKTLRKER